ncbi:hypothetical protein LL998_08670 [Burkholderia ambifaria]|uniref:hypothetical protein n=1 Tax=Burkholderia ambifaria TaxID=152480 RepID=UPI001E419F55|nr:hypothetical protein [Burkholderia ambifaria]UEP33297.1 hypothetical protein LL998_08670 [Burkholderia ambifaria]
MPSDRYNPPIVSEQHLVARCKPAGLFRIGAEREKFVAARYDGPPGIAAVRYPF